jgi:hypothetical protein
MEPLLPFETRMELAIAEMSLEEKDSCRSIAMKYSLNHTTLSRRFKGEQVSRTVANSEYRQRLSSKQEETFLKYINKLSDRGLPPTSQIAKNIAEEIVGGEVGKNWVGDFVKRHKDQVKSLYLRNMDGVRVKAEYAPIFKQFYDKVILLLILIIKY